MTAPRVPTIGDRLPRRTPWADLADSSQECSKDETHLVPPAPLVDDSYDTPAVGVENPKDGLNSRLSRAIIKGPINFDFLIDDAESPHKGKNGSQAAGSVSAASAPAGTLNPAAPVFIPTSTATASSAASVAQPTSPSMPPPAVPQAATKAKRTRGKRPLGNSVQEPAVKRTREQDQAAGQQAQAQRVIPFVEPPPATEEEWQHRIGKRIKVVTSIKESPEYRGYLAHRAPAARLSGEPRTPTAEDRNLSKRRWEYEIQQWRNGLKQWYAENLPEAAAMQLDEAAGLAVPEDQDELEDHSPGD